jgi:transposase
MIEEFEKLLANGATFKDIERAAILAALELSAGSTSKASKQLGISVRKIQYRIRQYQKEGYEPRVAQAPKVVERGVSFTQSEAKIIHTPGTCPGCHLCVDSR